MKNRLAVAALSALVTFVGVATAPAVADSPSPAASPAPTPTAKPDRAIAARVKEWLGRLESGNIDRSQLTQAMNVALTDSMVAGVSNRLGPFGAPTQFDQSQVLHQDGNTAYVYAVGFANGSTWLFLFALDDATGKISGLRITPAE